MFSEAINSIFSRWRPNSSAMDAAISGSASASPRVKNGEFSETEWATADITTTLLRSRPDLEGSGTDRGFTLPRAPNLARLSLLSQTANRHPEKADFRHFYHLARPG